MLGTIVQVPQHPQPRLQAWQVCIVYVNYSRRPRVYVCDHSRTSRYALLQQLKSYVRTAISSHDVNGAHEKSFSMTNVWIPCSVSDEGGVRSHRSCGWQYPTDGIRTITAGKVRIFRVIGWHDARAVLLSRSHFKDISAL
jgi:hypothetical protein